MSPYFFIPPSPTIKLTKTSKRTIDHQFINNGRTLLCLFLLYFTARARARAKKHQPTTHYGTSSHVAVEIRNRLPVVLCLTFRSQGPTHKTHGHLRMPSTPGVRGLSRRYILFPTRRQMHAKKNKYTIACKDWTVAASTPVQPTT